MTLKIGVQADVSSAKTAFKGLRQEVEQTAAAGQRLNRVKMDTAGISEAASKTAQLQQAINNISSGFTVSANTSDLDKALDGIQSLNAAIEKTGQGGKILKDIYLNPKNFQEANKVLLNVLTNLRTINRTDFGKNLNLRAKQTGQDVNNPLDWEFSKMFPGDPKAASAAYDRFMSEMIHGKSSGGILGSAPRPLKGVVSQITPEGGAAGGASGGGSSMAGAGRWMLGKASGLGMAAAGLAGVGSIIGAAVAGYREHVATMDSTESLFRRLGTGDSFDNLETGVRDLARSLQLTASESAKLADEYARESGRTGSPFEMAETAGLFGRGFGMDPNVSAQAFARSSLVGYGQDRTSQREFAALIASTIASSGMFSRGEQVMQDLVSQIGHIADSEGRTASQGEMGKYSEVLSALYKNDAMRGGGAQNFIQGLGGLGAGGDLTKEMFAWQAYGNAAGNDYINLERFKDANQFATVDSIVGNGDQTTKFDLGLNLLKKQAGWLPGQAADKRKLAYMLKMQTGMNMGLSEEGLSSLLNISDRENGTSGFMDWMKSNQLNLENLNPEALGNLSRLYEGRNSKMGSNYTDMARQYLSGDKTSASDKANLKRLLDSGDISGLQAMLPGVIGRTGGPSNPAEELRTATSKLTNALETVIGPKLTDLVTWLSGTGGSLLEGLGTKMSTLGDVLERIAGVMGVGKTAGEVAPGSAVLGENRPLGNGAALRALDNLTGGFLSGKRNDMTQNPEYLKHLSQLEKERGLPAGTLSRLMMQESSGQNKGYHRPDGATNPLHSDFGLFGIKKDYTGRQPGYGVKPLAGDSPEEQARFAADYLAAMVKQSGGIEGGLAGYHTGNPGGLDTEEGRNYVGMVKGQKVPISGFKNDTGNMGRFGYRGYGPLIDKKGFIIHHSGGRGDAEGVEKTFGERGFPAQYIIDRDAVIHQALPDGQRGQHISSEHLTALGKRLGLSNANTEGVEIIANDDKDVTPAQVMAADRLRKMLGYKADQVYGHGEINDHKQGTEGKQAVDAIRTQINAETPKTPESEQRAVKEIEKQSAVDARWAGQLAMEVVLKNQRGDTLHRRSGLAVSEPQMAGSGGSNPYNNRFVWNDEVIAPGVG